MSESAERPGALPRHLAIIMDGNGRWAKQNQLPRSQGHVRGADNARTIIEASSRAGVTHLTLFAFSSENWQRPEEEVRQIMHLFLNRLSSEMDTLQEHNIRLRILGDRQAFSPELVKQIEKTEQFTAANDGVFLNIAANYGGRWDICQAIQRLLERARDDEGLPSPITPEIVSSHLCTAGQPDPDLLIRTGGESRISNFLLWQLSYAELYFTDVLWPEFGPEELSRAFAWFAGRQRRFGRVAEQVPVAKGG